MRTKLSQQSLALVQQVEKMAYDRMLGLAVQRAAGEGRELVTVGDVRACIREALDEVARETDAACTETTGSKQ